MEFIVAETMFEMGVTDKLITLKMRNKYKKVRPVLSAGMATYLNIFLLQF